MARALVQEQPWLAQRRGRVERMKSAGAVHSPQDGREVEVEKLSAAVTEWELFGKARGVRGLAWSVGRRNR